MAIALSPPKTRSFMFVNYAQDQNVIPWSLPFKMFLFHIVTRHKIMCGKGKGCFMNKSTKSIYEGRKKSKDDTEGNRRLSSRKRELPIRN